MANHEGMLASAKYIAETVLAPSARQNDREGRFSIEAISALGEAGPHCGLMLPAELGGSGLGPRSPSRRSPRRSPKRTLGRHGLSDARCRRDDRCRSAPRASFRHPARDRRRPASVDPGIQRGRVAQPFLGAGLARATQRRRRAPHSQKIVGDERRTRPKLRGLGAVSRKAPARRIRPFTSFPRKRPAYRSRSLGRSWAACQRLRADDPGGLRGIGPSFS